MTRLTSVIENGIAVGLHHGAVVHVRRNGDAVADLAVGTSDPGSNTPLRTSQKILWLSAGKPLTALAVAILRDRGLLRFDDPVASIISEFAANGKDAITLRHILTHTHGYKSPPLDWPRQPRQAIIEKICAQAAPLPGVAPGSHAAYDPQSGWYILSEVVERITGTPNHEFIQQELLEPIGCAETSIGMDEESWTAQRESNLLAVHYDTSSTAREEINLAENPTAAQPWVGDDARRAAAHNPGGGAVGTAGDLSLLYQFLLDGGRTREGERLVEETTIVEMTRRQRTGMKDISFGQVIDWGLGVLVNSARYGNPALPYGYGQHASDSTFGHGGMQCACGFADPENGIAGAIIFNGLPGEPKHQKRVNQAMTALYEDLNQAAAYCR